MPAPGSAESPTRFLLHFVLMAGTAAILAGGAAYLVWTVTPPINYDAAFQARITLPIYCFYAWQPGKYHAYVAACVVGTLGLFLGHRLALLFLPRVSIGAARLLLAAAAMVLLLFFGASLVPLWVCPIPPFWSIPPSFLLYGWYFQQHPVDWAWSGAVCLALAAGTLWLGFGRGPRHAAATVALFALAVLIAPSRFYAPSQIDESVAFIYHFATLSDPVSQVVNGHHYGVNFPHLYGGYVEFVGPLLRLLPRRTEILLLVFPIISNLAFLILLWTAARMIRQPALLLIAGLAVLCAEAQLTLADHYYNYQAVRIIGPALVMLAAAGYFRAPARRRAALTTGLAVLATIWNTDSGLVAWIAWLAAYAFEGWAQAGLRAAGSRLANGVGIMAAGLALFILYLRVVAGAWPDFRLFFLSQRAMVRDGYFCVRLVYPGVWDLAILTALIGLALALLLILTGRATWRSHWMLFLAMLSLGTFGYYLGRAVESNFVVILFPFLLLAGLLADEMIVLVRDGRVPPAAWIYLVPSLAMLAWWTVLPAVGLPAMVASGMKEIDAWRNPARPPVEAAAAFIESKARPGEPGYILSRQNGFLYYLTGVVNPVRMAGLVELFYETDLDELVGALNRGAIPKLFVDTDFFTPPLYRPEVNQRLRQAIALHYRAVATDATGRLTYLTPLSSSP